MAEPTPTVYSYYTPEIRHTVEKTLNDLNFGLRGVANIHDTLKQNFDPGLDDLHLPLMEKYEAFARSEGVIGLDTFENKYFTNGSSEGIFHVLNGLNPAEHLYQLDGEYQGYQKYADALCRPITTCTDLDDLMTSATGIVILSNPASKDGNIVDPNVLTTIMRKHDVILDLAYMGMTRKPLNVDLTQPKILAVVGSLSKPFGLYYYRIGFCYSKDAIDSLYANKWFKNALSIKIGEAVLDEAAPKKLAAFKQKYFDLQEHAVIELNDRFKLLPGSHINRAKASDVWLLAHAPLRDLDPQALRPFKRGEQNYRFCLTPYYMEWENA